MVIAAVWVQVPLRAPRQRTNRRETGGSSFGLFISISKNERLQQEHETAHKHSTIMFLRLAIRQSRQQQYGSTSETGHRLDIADCYRSRHCHHTIHFRILRLRLGGNKLYRPGWQTVATRRNGGFTAHDKPHNRLHLYLRHPMRLCYARQSTIHQRNELFATSAVPTKHC